MRSGFFDLMSATSASESAANSLDGAHAEPLQRGDRSRADTSQTSDRERRRTRRRTRARRPGACRRTRSKPPASAAAPRRLAGDDRPNARSPRRGVVSVGDTHAHASSTNGDTSGRARPRRRRPGPRRPSRRSPRDAAASVRAGRRRKPRGPEDPRDAAEDEPSPRVDDVAYDPPPPPFTRARDFLSSSRGSVSLPPRPDSRFIPHGATPFLAPSANPMVAPGLDRSLSPNLVFLSLVSSSSDASAPSTTTPPVRFTRCSLRLI